MVEKLSKMRITIVLYALFLFNIILIYSNLSIYPQGYGKNGTFSDLYLLLNSIEWEWYGLQILSISIIVTFIMVGLKKIKEYKTMENKLDTFKSIYLSLFEMTSGAIFVFSDNGILLTNAQADEMFGTKKGGKQCITNNKYFKQLTNLVLESSVPLHLSGYKIVDQEDVEHYYDIDTINNSVGNQKMGMIIIKDKVEEKKETFDLEVKLPYSQELLAKICHELRTPINVLQGVITNSLVTIHQIEDQEIREKMLRYTAVFDRNLLRMLKLSENIIHLMEMNACHETLAFENCNVPNLIKNITDASMDYANQKKLRIELLNNMQSNYCAVDIDKFEKMILNLLSNAIKYGQKDSKILININETSQKLNIDVCSKGNKIEPKEQEKMFKLFHQGENLLTRTHEGLGLGLHFVKEYAKMHGGKVGISSDCEGNNVFSINLPMFTNDRFKYADVIREMDICRQKVRVEFSDI